MSTVGIYRYKIGSVPSSGATITFKVGGVDIKVCTVQNIASCYGRILKYLNRDGQYRLFPFNQYYEENETPKQIGKVNTIVKSILTSQAESKNAGYKSERKILLKADGITSDQLDVLKDLYTSPRVYLYIGSGTDLASDWLLVTVKVDKNIRKERKGNFTTINVEVQLPEIYSITML